MIDLLAANADTIGMTALIGSAAMGREVTRWVKRLRANDEADSSAAAD